jgi:hypothetical protein
MALLQQSDNALGGLRRFAINGLYSASLGFIWLIGLGLLQAVSIPIRGIYTFYVHNSPVERELRILFRIFYRGMGFKIKRKSKPSINSRNKNFIYV